MRQYLFYFLLFSSPIAFSADCLNLPTAGTYNCDNLYITTPQVIAQAPAPNDVDPVIVNVTGEVIISANISVDGGDGINIPGYHAGPFGGPAAGNGGGRNFGPPEDALDPAFPPPGGHASNGKAVNNTTVCGNGGSGGGFYNVGSGGLRCTGGSANLALPGSAFALATNFTLFTLANFRGGFGGGSGDETTTPTELGTGGGGGGALYINAGGDITINAGVTISARGGNGGNATTDGGGGGGGSGGAIWLETAGDIFISGVIDVRGGEGGKNPIKAGNGGNGGNGVYRIQSITGTVDGSGRLLPPAIAPTVGAESLKSDISCGTVKTKNNEHLIQMVGAFIFAIMVMEFVRKLMLMFRSHE